MYEEKKKKRSNQKCDLFREDEPWGWVADLGSLDGTKGGGFQADTKRTIQCNKNRHKSPTQPRIWIGDGRRGNNLWIGRREEIGRNERTDAKITYFSHGTDQNLRRGFLFARN